MNIALLQENALQMSLSILIYTCITIYIQNKILSEVLIIDKNSIKRTWIIQTILVSFIRLGISMPYSIILEVLAQILIYKYAINLRFTKLLILEEINVIISTSINLICTKINHTNLFSQVSNNIFMFFYAEIVGICIYLIIYIILKNLKINLIIPEYINKKSKKQIIEFSILSTIFIIINKIGLFNMLDILPSYIYFIGIILIISYYLITIVGINKTIQVEMEKNKVNELKGNNQRLKESFDDMRSFRHDIKNIMQGLGGYIATKDIDGLSNMYKEFINDYKKLENSKDFEELLKLNPAIYNIINNKYLEAKKENININVEIYVDLNSLKIKTYELCRVLGILIDNAIEATRECDNKQISIKFIKDNYNNRSLIIIENPCKNALLDLPKLKEKGFTTKKDKLFHGLGLWRVNQIVRKNENLRLSTTRDKMFKQQLEIYNW